MNNQNEHDASDDCDKCPNGRYRTQEYDSASCVACNAGKYLSGNVAGDHASETKCKICQQSRYTNQNGRGSCKWCSAGKYISDHMNNQNEHDSSDDCGKCSNGYYRTQEHNSASCVACNAGKYLSGNVASDHASESNCKICERSRYTNENARAVVSGVLRENTFLII